MTVTDISLLSNPLEKSVASLEKIHSILNKINDSAQKLTNIPSKLDEILVQLTDIKNLLSITKNTNLINQKNPENTEFLSQMLTNFGVPAAAVSTAIFILDIIGEFIKAMIISLGVDKIKSKMGDFGGLGKTTKDMSGGLGKTTKDMFGGLGNVKDKIFDSLGQTMQKMSGKWGENIQKMSGKWSKFTSILSKVIKNPFIIISAGMRSVIFLIGMVSRAFYALGAVILAHPIVTFFAVCIGALAALMMNIDLAIQSWDNFILSMNWSFDAGIGSMLRGIKRIVDRFKEITGQTLPVTKQAKTIKQTDIPEYTNPIKYMTLFEQYKFLQKNIPLPTSPDINYKDPVTKQAKTIKQTDIPEYTKPINNIQSFEQNEFFKKSIPFPTSPDINLYDVPKYPQPQGLNKVSQFHLDFLSKNKEHFEGTGKNIIAKVPVAGYMRTATVNTFAKSIHGRKSTSDSLSSKGNTTNVVIEKVEIADGVISNLGEFVARLQTRIPTA